MRLVLLHYHILKNGGSTVEEVLRRSLFQQFASFDHPDRDAEIKHEELIDYLKRHPELKAFSSHQIFYPVPKDPGFLFFDLCFLRDPFDRIRSIYDYFRRKPAGDDPVRLLARENSPRNFVRRLMEEMPWIVADVQVNLLANGVVNDTPRHEDLKKAKRRMLETSFLGVVDRFEESLVAGEYAMRTVFPAIDCAQAKVNESARPGSTMEQRLERFRVDVGEDVFSELSRLNQMDCELLRLARQEVRQRFESTPRAEERLREIREGIPRRFRPRSTTIRKKPAAAKAGALTRWTRGLRFLLDFRMSRPGSEFRRLFDAEYYGGTLWNYVTQGAFEGRDPHPLFDTKFFLRGSSPKANPLADYLRYRGRPHPLFDPGYYTRRYPDVVEARMNPLLHYALHGAAEGRKPNPWFVPEFYLAACAEAREARDPLVHFAETEAANPHPLFDCESYRREHPEIEVNALADFLARGEQQEPDGVRIEIDEVSVTVVVWEECGHKKFSCDAHLKRFFESVREDQVMGQVANLHVGC